MIDTVRLEVAATPDSLPLVRMIVGGVGARLEFALDDLQDVYLLLEELFCTLSAPASGDRLAITIEAGDDALSVDAGPFVSPSLRRRLSGAAGEGEIDLQALYGRVVEELGVCAAGDECYSVVFSKSRGRG